MSDTLGIGKILNKLSDIGVQVMLTQRYNMEDETLPIYRAYIYFRRPGNNYQDKVHGDSTVESTALYIAASRLPSYLKEKL